MNHVYTFICDKIMAGEPVEEVKEAAWRILSKDLAGFNAKLHPRDRIKETLQVSSYLKNYVVEAIAHLQEFVSKELLMRREVNQLLEEYGRRFWIHRKRYRN